MDSDELFKDGQYARALTNYQIALSGELPPAEAEWAKYRIAACLYEMKAYADANEALQRYLIEYPAGAYLPDARRLLRQIAEDEQKKRQQRAGEYASLVRRIQDARQELVAAQNPRDQAKIHYRLGDLQWQLGNFEESARHYAAAVHLNPAYETDSEMVKRVRMTDDGRIEPRHPTVGRDLFGNDGPLRVVGTQTSIEPVFDQFQDRRLFVVSGDIQNQSIRSYRRITLHVTVYDLQDHVLGSRVLQFPVIESGDTMPFRVAFPIQGTVMNVSRYQCRLIYDRS